MGKIISNKDIVKNNIKEFLDSSNTYSKYLEGSPTFVTYYNYNRVDSTTDAGLENVIEIVGAESPSKYRKIVDMPVYGINQNPPNIENGEFGLTSNIENECIILPNTIKPYVNDFFEVAYDSTKLLFQINEVQIDKMNTGVQFYKCTFIISNKNINTIEEQVPSGDTFEILYENIGTELNSVIQTDKFRILDNIDNIQHKLVQFYDSYFRHKRFNVLYFKEDYIINSIDPYVHEFIKNENLFKLKESYLSTIVIDNILLEKDAKFRNNYQSTIYYAVESKCIDKAINNYYLTAIDDYRMPFYNHYEDFYMMNYISGNAKIYNGNLIKSLFKETFFNNIKNNFLYTNSEVDGLENIIIYYINRVELNFTTEDMEFIIDILLKYECYAEPNTYTLIPCILYILKQMEKSILNRISRKETTVYV